MYPLVVFFFGKKVGGGLVPSPSGPSLYTVLVDAEIEGVSHFKFDIPNTVNDSCFEILPF